MRSAALVLSFLLAACASTPEERTFYLLRSDTPRATGAVQAPLRVGLERISVAPYLDQEGLVVETAPGRVRPAHRHHWAEPLAAGLRSFLRAEISSELGYEVSAGGFDRLAWDTVVDVHVDRMHGTLDGTAILDTSYRIRRAGAETVEYRFSATAPLPAEGYAGLVDAETRLARELAVAIAASLKAL